MHSSGVPHANGVVARSIRFVPGRGVLLLASACTTWPAGEPASRARGAATGPRLPQLAISPFDRFAGSRADLFDFAAPVMRRLQLEPATGQ